MLIKMFHRKVLTVICELVCTEGRTVTWWTAAIRRFLLLVLSNTSTIYMAWINGVPYSFFSIKTIVNKPSKPSNFFFFPLYYLIEILWFSGQVKIHKTAWVLYIFGNFFLLSFLKATNHWLHDFVIIIERYLNLIISANVYKCIFRWTSVNNDKDRFIKQLLIYYMVFRFQCFYSQNFISLLIKINKKGITCFISQVKGSIYSIRKHCH